VISAGVLYGWNLSGNSLNSFHSAAVQPSCTNWILHTSVKRVFGHAAAAIAALVLALGVSPVAGIHDAD
jgi:hypothetical protein